MAKLLGWIELVFRKSSTLYEDWSDSPSNEGIFLGTVPTTTQATCR